MEGGTSHKKLKVSRGANWSLDDRKDLLEAIKIEIKTTEDKKCDRDALRIKLTYTFQNKLVVIIRL